MLARTPSTTGKLVSIGALMAAAAIFAPPGSKAQTLANLESDRAAYLERQCGHIRDGAEQVGCMAAKSIEFSRAQTEAARKEAAEHRRVREAIEKQSAATTAEHQKAAGAARTEAQCLSTISDAITGKRVTPAEVRLAFKTPTETTNACEVVRRLQPRLGELTKQ